MGLVGGRGCRELASQLHPLLEWMGQSGMGLARGRGLWANQIRGRGEGLKEGGEVWPATSPSIRVGESNGGRAGWGGERGRGRLASQLHPLIGQFAGCSGCHSNWSFQHYCHWLFIYR